MLNPVSSDRRFTPYSTFKIPNFLIALETGAVNEPTEELAWKAEQRPRLSYWPDDWARDHSLHSAFRSSAVWFFQNVAMEVESENYVGYLRKFEYGNAVAPDGSDSFWLDGSLKVSPSEQVRFLHRMLGGEFALSPPTLEALHAAAFLRRYGEVELYGKTGAGPLQPSVANGSFGGWLIGWLKRPAGNHFIFALYVEAPTFRDLASMRIAASEDLLRQAGALPHDP